MKIPRRPPQIEPMLKSVQPLLPLRITAVDREGENLHVGGVDWHFNTLSVWRVVSSTRVLFACYDSDDLMAQVDNLVGRLIIDLRVQSTCVGVDPVFVLDDGRRLEIFSTDTFEPWTFHSPSGDVFIASPSMEDPFS